VVEGDTRLLLDCGTGVLANLQKHFNEERTSIENLTGIVISHMHADHFLDLIPLRYALVYGGLHRPTPLPIHLPPGARSIWERIVQPFDETRGSFSTPFELLEYRDRQNYHIGALQLRMTLLRHYVPNYGIEITGKARLVYSGDCGPDPNLTRLAQKADLLLCEATWLEHEASPFDRGHLLAQEAGKMAREAGVRRLVLTHISPEADSKEILNAAQAEFDGEVSLAEEGRTFIIG